jgi:NlpC/P60 family putative phage cell wall peptidase
MSTIIEQARTWVGTPYKHQGRQKGVGVDCLGVIYGSMLEAGVKDKVFFDKINSKYHDYNRLPSGRMLYTTFKKYVPEYPKNQAKGGDMLMIALKGEPRHTAILTDKNTIIHAYAEAGKCVENRYAHYWKKNTVTCFRLSEAY